MDICSVCRLKGEWCICSSDGATFDEQIQNLAKIVVNSLDKKQLDPHADDAINALKNFLENNATESAFITAIISAFRMLQNIRSAGAAHRKGKRYTQLIDKYNLKDMTNQS